jgi:hypothetical protein
MLDFLCSLVQNYIENSQVLNSIEHLPLIVTAPVNLQNLIVAIRIRGIRQLIVTVTIVDVIIGSLSWISSALIKMKQDHILTYVLSLSRS